MRVIRSIGVTFVVVGSRSVPGGWKCTRLGAGSCVRVGCRRQRDGAAPYSRRNARVKPSCESKPASIATSSTGGR